MDTRNRKFQILFSDSFRKRDVVVGYAPESLTWKPQDKFLIDEIWSQKLVETDVKGFKLFDGSLFRFERFVITRGVLRLELADTSYKEYVGTRDSRFIQGRSHGELANPLAVCATIRTVDGKIVVERRSQVDLYEGRYHVIGGFFDRTLDAGKDRIPDPFAAIRREVREEIGCLADEEGLILLGLAYDLETPHPELCFAADSKMSATDLVALLENAGTDHEVKRLEFIPDSPAALAEFIQRNHGNISSTGEACLLLYGARAYGANWHEAVLEAIGFPVEWRLGLA